MNTLKNEGKHGKLGLGFLLALKGQVLVVSFLVGQVEHPGADWSRQWGGSRERGSGPYASPIPGSVGAMSLVAPCGFSALLPAAPCIAFPIET